MSEETKMPEEAGTLPKAVPEIPFTTDSIAPVLRKTDANVPIQLLEEVLSCPKEHVTVRCIVYPDNSQRQFTMTIRGDSMIPRYRSTHEGQVKHSDVQYKMPDMKIEAPVVLDAEGNKVVSPEILEKMAKARRGRKASAIDYSKISDDIACSKCGTEKKLGKYAIGAKAKALGVTIDELLKTFLCSACNPKKRGRQASAKYAGLPTQVACSEVGCRFTQKQQPAASEKAAKAAGLGFNEYIKSWKCKFHRGHKAHHFSKEARAERGEVAKVYAPVKAPAEAKPHRGRVADPKWVGMAKELVCHHSGCKKVQPQHPSLTLAAANRAGLNFEEFVGGWKCRQHRS